MSSVKGSPSGSHVLSPDFDGTDYHAQQAVRELDAGKTLAAHRIVKAGFGPIHTSHIKVARAIKRDFEEHVKEVIDPWLKDCPPLPKARAPQWNERGGR